MNKTDIKMMNRNKINKNLYLDSKIIFNDFQKKSKINKKKMHLQRKAKNDLSADIFSSKREK